MLMFRGDFLAYIIMQIDEVHWRDAVSDASQRGSRRQAPVFLAHNEITRDSFAL